MMAAIQDTCTKEGIQLLDSIWQKLKDVDIKLQDILSLATTQQQKYKDSFPIIVLIPAYIFMQDQKQGQEQKMLTQHIQFKKQIKKVFIAALMYPPQLQDQKADFLYIQKYIKVPLQQTICAELGHQQARKAFESLLFFSYSQSHRFHPFVARAQKYNKQNKNLQRQNEQTMRKIYIKRQAKPIMYTKKMLIPSMATESYKFYQLMQSYYNTVYNNLKSKDLI